MSRWKRSALAQIHVLARQGAVLVTRKAVQELEDLEVGLLPSDLPEVLLGLQEEHLVERIRSEHDSLWLYVFNPEVEGLSVYLKVAVREDCVVISFHEFQGD